MCTRNRFVSIYIFFRVLWIVWSSFSVSVRMSGDFFEYFGNMAADLLSQCPFVPSSFDFVLFYFLKSCEFHGAVSLFVFVVLEWRCVTRLLSSITTVCVECVLTATVYRISRASEAADFGVCGRRTILNGVHRHRKEGARRTVQTLIVSCKYLPNKWNNKHHHHIAADRRRR